MADTFDPDIYLAGTAPEPQKFDPDAYLGAKTARAASAAGEGRSAKEMPATGILSPVTDIPREMADTTYSALSGAAHYLNPFSSERKAAMLRGDVLEPFLDTGRGLLSAAGVPTAPFQGAARSIIGHPLSALTGMSYEEAKEKADLAMMGLAPRGFSPVGARPPAPVPAAPTPNGPLGVTLSEGQLTGELPLIQREQAALRGALGDNAQARAKEFADQQRGEVESATEGVAKQLDPFGQTVAETPQQAGQFVSEGIQNAAAQRKAGVKQTYDEAKSYPGEIHAGAFENIGSKIKSELSQGSDPVIIDDKLTPFASHAIRDVEDRISNLIIQNRADPLGAPSPENIVGVDLKGVDQMRKRLSAFRKDAYGSGNAADGRAAQAVIRAFDNQVHSAVNGGLFNGDPRAIQAWNDARAAHSDYMSTFAAGKNDPIGRVVEKIIGKGNNPAAIPNDVADFIYGGSGVNPSSLNVGVARRVRDVLGEQSPEWSAVKQGLFSKLVDAGPGVTDWGPGKIAQRVNKFMNADGLELSKEVFSPQERRLIQQYADLQRTLQVPQAGANWSNTSTVLAPMLKKISGGVAAVVGAVVGHTFAPGLYGIGEAAGAAAASKVSKTFGDAKQLKQVSKQMPIVSEAMQKWQRAAALANKANTPASQRTMNIASANLARSLQNIGVNPVALFRQVQGVSPIQASDQQQQQ